MGVKKLENFMKNQINSYEVIDVFAEINKFKA